MTIRTVASQAVDEDHRVRGHSLLFDLFHNETPTGVIALVIGGRRLTKEELAVVDHYFVAVVAADPRIWPLKAGRLVGSYGGIMVPYAAAHLSTDSEVIGVGAVGGSGRFLVEVRDDVERGTPIADAVRSALKRRSRVNGFGVAFRPDDERYVVFEKFMRDVGRHELPFWKLHYAVAEVMMAETRLKPNMVLGAAAAFMDFGFSPHEAQLLATSAVELAFQVNITEAPWVEAQRLGPEATNYVGPAPRNSPRKSGTS